MNSAIRLKRSFAVIAFAVIAFSASAVQAQDARLRLEHLTELENRAADMVEVNIEGGLLTMARRVLGKMKDQDSRKIGEAIAGLQGIYVRVYNFANDNEYSTGDVEAIRAQLRNPGWERMANVRSKRNNQLVDVYTMYSGKDMTGVAVVVSEARSIAVVNVVGPIDIDLLTELSGNLNIPRIEIERDGERPKN